MLKCESCLSRFQQASDLFQHIQSSCLTFYKKHPEHWAQILSKMTGPIEEEGPSGSATNEVQTVEKIEPPVANEVPQANPSKKEPPFCIMFKAQKVKKGNPVVNLHMTVAEYYYGTEAGKKVETKQVSKTCKCPDCGKFLRNNIRFMSHLRHKILNRREKKEVADARNICNHCFREYCSPFLLQCHLENVHGAVAASTTCKICDSYLPTEREFLGHMKDIHLQNEAPYVCRVCTYRSSFYNDVVRHFREEHAGSNGMMCPFCLSVSFAAHTFSKHVLQHVKKGFACNRCRLIFNTTAERSTHQENDHLSQSMKEKMAKYKNSHLCQIYVRVAPYKDDSKDKISDLEKHLKGAHAPKVLKRPAAEVPVYLCPTKRSNCIRKILVAKDASLMGMRCMECGDNLPPDVLSVREHYRYQHECKWCVYVTSCERAAHDHVLSEHADSEMREQLFGKNVSEDTTFPIILQDDDDDNFDLSKIKEEPSEDVLPISSGYWESKDEKPEVMDISTMPAIPKLDSSTDVSQPAKGRRKQSNPTKITDVAQPAPAAKVPKRDRWVQTKGLEKEKGVQACDQDFQNLHGNVELSNNSDSKRKDNRRRKILAQPGYFPDIDDDAGWAKYFASIEKDSVTGKPAKSKVNPGNTDLPTMVPRQGTYSILNKALKAHRMENGSGPSDKGLSELTNGPLKHLMPDKESNVTGDGKQLNSTSVGSLPTQVNKLLRTAPQAPNNLRCIEVTHDHMLIQWDPPSNGSVTQYKIVFQGVGPQTVQLLPVQQTLVKLVGLKPNVMYAVRVYTFFYTGVSDYANIFVKTKPHPSSVAIAPKVSMETSSTSQYATHSVPTSVVHYRSSVTVGLPVSTYLALKSAAVNSTIRNVTVPTTMLGYMTASTKTDPKSSSVKLGSGISGSKVVVRHLPTTVTARTVSQIQHPNLSTVAPVATISSLNKPVISAVVSQVPSTSGSKANKSASSSPARDDDVVYLVLDDEEDDGKSGQCADGSSTKSDGSGDDVIIVLDDDKALPDEADQSSPLSVSDSTDDLASVSLYSPGDTPTDSDSDLERIDGHDSTVTVGSSEKVDRAEKNSVEKELGTGNLGETDNNSEGKMCKKDDDSNEQDPGVGDGTASKDSVQMDTEQIKQNNLNDADKMTTTSSNDTETVCDSTSPDEYEPAAVLNAEMARPTETEMVTAETEAIDSNLQKERDGGDNKMESNVESLGAEEAMVVETAGSSSAECTEDLELSTTTPQNDAVEAGMAASEIIPVKEHNLDAETGFNASDNDGNANSNADTLKLLDTESPTSVECMEVVNTPQTPIVEAQLDTSSVENSKQTSPLSESIGLQGDTSDKMCNENTNDVVKESVDSISAPTNVPAPVNAMEATDMDDGTSNIATQQAELGCSPTANTPQNDVIASALEENRSKSTVANGLDNRVSNSSSIAEGLFLSDPIQALSGEAEVGMEGSGLPRDDAIAQTVNATTIQNEGVKSSVPDMDDSLSGINDNDIVKPTLSLDDIDELLDDKDMFWL